MVALANTFNGGTDAATVTTANSGGASGDAFGTVFDSATGFINYDDAQSISGSMAGLFFSTSATTSTSFVALHTSAAGITTVEYMRMYFRVAALPVSVMNIIQFKESVVATTGCSIQLRDTGTLQLVAPATARYTSSTVVAANTWYRIEAKVTTNATTGHMEARIFHGANLHGTTADEEFGSATADWDTGDGTHGQLRVGMLVNPGVSGFNLWIDDIAVNDTGWVGPSSSPTVPAAVTNLAGTAGNAQVPLTWTAPADGGSAITDYIVQYRVAP